MSLNKRLFPKSADAAVDPTEHFDPKTYTGNSSTQSITGVGFQPDLIWIKSRSTVADNHYLMDSLRGKNGSTVFENVYPNLTNAQANDNGVTSMDSDGFTLSNNNGNTSSRNYVAWCWKAGGAPSGSDKVSIDGTSYATMTEAGLTDGTEPIDKLSVNTKLGFSIVKYTAPALTGDTVAHGLGETPEMIILKSTSVARNWNVYHKDVGTSKNFHLNTTDAANTAEYWTANANTFSIQDYSASAHWIAYCFTSKTGVSKIGSFEGNSNSTGVTITTGFQPRFVLIKPIDIAVDWSIFDAERGENLKLSSNSQSGDSSGWDSYFDFLSDGFRVKGSSSALNPASTVIYMAFA